MKRALVASLCFLAISPVLFSQERVKNLILMIPDGTSSNILSLARWYRFGICRADNCRLAIDPHICGMVSTYNSDSPIGDSAPTGSTYATGYLSNTGFVATYPVSSGKMRDLVEVDPLRAYHPLFTILEAARIQGKSTGLVVTSEFPHATPADFSAHTPDRDDEEGIAAQMVYNHLNVVFGGGLQYLDPAHRKDGQNLFNILRTRNYRLVSTVNEFDALTPFDTLVYGLFTEKYLPNDLDRDPDQVPSLAEMTRKAIKILAENPKGFFLMVEGSKIDWSAHQNDPVGIVTEYLAFDDAVKEAMDFANRDGYTAVVIVPDHGNSGISLGNSRSNSNYDVLPLLDLLQPLYHCKKTVEWISDAVMENPEKTEQIFFDNTGIRLTFEEIEQVTLALHSDNPYLLPITLAHLINQNTYIGFTTHGHTGEDVLLAVYHPGQYRPSGVIKNTRLHQYMTEILATPDLDSLTAARFCIDTLALQGVAWTIQHAGDERAHLVISLPKDTRIRAEVVASTDYITIIRKEKPVQTIPLGSLALYVESLGHFFIPANLGERLRNEILP
ncbi:MAG: alkaline phosphatase [Bacteroidetes bacterium]|nr:MAG: alkaline phosphatase [Bacteroidota bacterium]